MALARAQGRTVKPDQLPDRGFFYRSDQFNFAKLGIPAAYFGSGMDFVGRPRGLGQGAAGEVGGRALPPALGRAAPGLGLLRRGGGRAALLPPRRRTWPGRASCPRWNKGDEFEAPRLQALEALRSEGGEVAPAPSFRERTDDGTIGPASPHSGC